LLLCTKKKRKGKERGGNAPFLAILRLPVAATPADELALTKADLTDADTSAIGIVTRSLDHLTTADEDRTWWMLLVEEPKKTRSPA